MRNVSSKFLERTLSYVIVPVRPAFLSPQALHNKTYRYWKDFWVSLLKENGSEETLRLDDYFRQDLITCLIQGNEIVAMMAHTFFDLRLEASKDHSYFKRFTEKFFSALKARGTSRVMTYEFFSVPKNWSHGQYGVSVGTILAGLNLKLAEMWKVDATIAVARSSNAAKVAFSFGAQSFDSNVIVHNTPCDLIAFYPDKIHPHAENVVNQAIDCLWQKRQDYSVTPFLPAERKVS